LDSQRSTLRFFQKIPQCGISFNFKKLKDKALRLAFKNAIDILAENPYAGSQKTGDLRGIYGYEVLVIIKR